jgi:transcriptional regulator with GAF, ATPase, and Fis domain
VTGVGGEETKTIMAGAEAPAVSAKLVVMSGPDEGKEISLESEAVVGSGAGAALRLSDSGVSRAHAAFVSDGANIRIRDLGSRNGTHVGEARVKEADVPVGTVVRLGATSLAIQPRWYMREVAPSDARRFGDLLGESVAMREVFAMLERVSPTDVTVLVEGESGTGKELAARSIHRASPRRDAPYVVFDCGAVPPELAESELFGHKKGAFSGAVSDREGAFNRADGGTICLDEIGELPIELQPKLLRVLETGEVRSVGEDALKKVDVRVVAATNRDLAAEARSGRFRSDLLYRLAVVRVRLPPLRHRPEDIPMLVSKLLEDELPEGDVIAGDNLARLTSYGWPGNVRELRNVLTRAVSLGNVPGKPVVPFSELVFNLGPAPEAPHTIGVTYPGVASPLPFKQAREQLMTSFERAYVEAVLERHGGNVTKAAKAAGVSRKYFYEIMQRSIGS